MRTTKHLPLIALVTLGVAACGDDIETVEEDEVVVVEPEDGLGAGEAEYGETDVLEEDEAMMLEDDDALFEDENQMAMSEEGAVMVSISGVQPNAGQVYVALQSEDDFADAGGDYTEILNDDRAVVDVTFEDVPRGEWAVAAFQDLNGDGTLTMGETGPTEPWGFSGNVDRTQAPGFDNAMIRVDGGENMANVALMGGQM